MQDRAKLDDAAREPDPSGAERTRILQALHTSEERFRRLSEVCYEGVSIVENDRVVDANSQAAAMLGYEPSEYIGMQVMALIAPESRALAAQHMRAEDKRPWEGLGLHKNGSKVSLQARSRVIHSGDTVTRVVVFRDVSEQRAMEERLRETEKLQVIGRLAGTVAHDFNNLLTVILGCAHLLEDELADRESTRSLATEIAAAGDRASALTRQLLAFSRRQVVDLRVIDANVVIHGMSQMLARLLGEDVHLSMRLATHPVPVRADAGQFEQVLMNLCTNARDAMPEGGEIVICTEIVPMPSGNDLATGRWVHLVVTDGGHGMAPATLSRALEPLFTTKGVGRGTGLGLATVQAIVSQSGGRLSIESSIGTGTTVHVWLPAAEGGDVFASGPARDAVSPRGAEVVLLVEDDDAVRALCDGVLRSLGYSVILATPTDAERMVNAHRGPIDLLISDVVMPGLRGPAVAAMVQSSRPAVRVLYVSGYSDELLTGRMGGGAEFLAKPFTPTELARKVREVLDRAR